MIYKEQRNSSAMALPVLMTGMGINLCVAMALGVIESPVAVQGAGYAFLVLALALTGLILTTISMHRRAGGRPGRRVRIRGPRPDEREEFLFGRHLKGGEPTAIFRAGFCHFIHTEPVP